MHCSPTTVVLICELAVIAMTVVAVLIPIVVTISAFVTTTHDVHHVRTTLYHFNALFDLVIGLLHACAVMLHLVRFALIAQFYYLPFVN